VKAALALGAAVALGGCATGSVVLLPSEGGADTGALAVIDDRGREVLVDRPLTSAALGTSSRPQPVRKLKASYSRLLTSLPPGAIGFVLNFPQGSTQLTPDSRPVLDTIRQEVARRPGAEVQVTGHTDTVDSAERNDRLSQERAEAVMALLIAEGFPADILTAVGRGERELLVPTADNVPNDSNRRVEVIVR
jgi:outer membrane protein OmpA-like peptidoglycan-associated protein